MRHAEPWKERLSHHDRNPFTIIANFQISCAQLQQTRLNHLDLRVEDSRQDQTATTDAQQHWQQLDNQGRRKIRANQISGWSLLINAADSEINLIPDVVQARILFRDRNRPGVNVAGRDVRFGKHSRRRDCQNSGSGSNIQEAAAAKIFLDCFQTQPRRFVCAGAKGHAGVDVNDDWRLT